MQLKRKLLIGAVVSSLGGLLFGFDTAVISGAEQGLKAFYLLDNFAHGFTNSIALILLIQEHKNLVHLLLLFDYLHRVRIGQELHLFLQRTYHVQSLLV